ncbi:MAG: iron-containing redox enzyme family protein [Mycobacterium sp.]
MPPTAPLTEPHLPVAAGPLSATVLEVLGGRPQRRHIARIAAPVTDSDPWGIDLQLALYICYELHYRGFQAVDAGWEWNPGLLHLRAQLESAFLDAVTSEVGSLEEDSTATAVMDKISVEPADGAGPSYFLRDKGTWEQAREYFVHRSLYHLKEADPHAWAIPRLRGQAKASFVAVEFDEYGGGRGEHVHQELFADLLTAAHLDASYLGYLDHVPAQALSVVNLMSMFGLHRELRGAAVGHFAATEITSPPGSARLVEGLERLGAPAPCVRFYREHVEADAVHEQVVRTDVVGELIRMEPHLERDVIFGIHAFSVVEDHLAELLMSDWTAGRSTLRRPVD